MKLFVSAWFAVLGVSFAPACSKETPPAPPAAPVPAPETPKAPPTVVEPKPAEPAAVEPKPAEPAPAEPKPAEPAPAEPAPAEPAPTEPPPAEPAPAEPAPTEPAGDGDAAPEKMHDISLNAVELTKEVVDRLPGEVRSNWVIGQDPEFLIWMEFNNPGSEVELETVWKKGGTEKWRFPFNVGKAKNWRTYVTKRIGKRDAGDWTVEIVDAGGYVYKSVPFTISEN